MERKWGIPVVCNDGVTIAKEVDLKDPEENLGVGSAQKRREMLAHQPVEHRVFGSTRPVWRGAAGRHAESAWPI